jgi:ribonuclease P/MRP protein subunit POP1
MLIIDDNRFLTGTRVLDTHIYKPGSYPFDLIAPITIMWKPSQPNADKSSSKDLEPTEEQRNTKNTTSKKKKRQNKGKGKVSTQNIQQSSDQAPSLDIDPRIVWVRSHPAVFDEVFSALQMSASSTLETIKRSSSTAEVPSVEVEIADLREQINVFEIMGPKSSQVLKGALTPVGEDKREEFKKVGQC